MGHALFVEVDTLDGRVGFALRNDRPVSPRDVLVEVAAAAPSERSAYVLGLVAVLVRHALPPECADAIVDTVGRLGALDPVFCRLVEVAIADLGAHDWALDLATAIARHGGAHAG